MASHLHLLHAPPLSIPTKTFHSKYITIKPLKPTSTFPSSSSIFQCSSKTTHRGSCSSFIAYSSSNGRSSNDSVDDGGVKSVEQLVEEKRRAELSARIASGEFTVKQESGYVSITLKFANFHSFIDFLS
jgi:beta-ring hydroxylase